MHIIGTAGHVDHGKSSLVQALTGTNPDRWIEEQERGMTLDLGFARLDFGDGIDAGIIDVPGHERFLHNMLAGAAGMELLLLVVAADEGVRPQTVEHLQILKYLDVRSAIIVVTKADLFEGDDLDFAIESIREQLRGTIVEGADAIAVSNVTRQGLETLRDAIHGELKSLPPRDVDAPAYLPVDRVFALQGFGTIVTGTLLQGSIAEGDSLVLQPRGLSVRVRSLQSFGTRRSRVEAGARVALNLPSIDVHDAARGSTVVAPQFEPAQSFSVSFRALKEALPILRRRNAVRAYVGSAEILGTMVLDAIPGDGEETGARLELRAPVAVFPGMPFVVRRLSPKTLLGGGRLQTERGAEPVLARETPAELQTIAQLQAGTLIASADDIARAANLRADVVQRALDSLVERGDAIAVARPQGYALRARADAVLARAESWMRLQEKAEPWIAGVTSLALSRALETDERELLRILAALVEDGRLAYRGGYFASVDFVPKLSPQQEQFFDSAVKADAEAPFLPVSLQSIVAEVRQSRVPGIGKAFDMLLVRGALVKVNDDLYRGSQLAAVRARLERFLQERGQITMAEFRDLTGTSRKYAVPLLEWFDARGITVRSGDFRMLRSAAPRATAGAQGPV